MRVVENVEKVVIDRKLISIICNKCGEVSEEIDYINTNQEFNLSFGYGSDYDTQNWQFDLCEKCLMEIVNEFQIEPEGFNK